MRRLCLAPRVAGVGGMVSFQRRMAAGLAVRGIETGLDLEDGPYDGLLLTGGTRHLGSLWRARRRGIPILQRLDGMNWLHRRKRTGLRHYLRAEYGNLLLRLIRDRLADVVVYQSEFARRWWEQARGPTPVPWQVVHNGVDLQVYSPQGPQKRPGDRWRLLLVEGSLMGGYETGLGTALSLAQELEKCLPPGRPLELVVVGRVPPELQARYASSGAVKVVWEGQAPAERIPEIDRSAHLFFSADLNPACPNAVIEALACGLPVVSFATGALPELVTGEAGRLAPYGGDPWRLEPPDVAGLAAAAAGLLDDPERFRQAARARAEAAFGLERMVDGYLKAFALRR